MKPGMSRRTSTGRLPTARSASITTATVASEVSSLRTTSTSGITSAGVKKCVPTKRSRRVTALARALIDRPEVLVAKIAPGAQMASSFAKMPRLSSRFSGTASITRSQSAAASRSGDMRMRAIASASSPAAYTPSWRAMLARARSSAPSTGSISTTGAPRAANSAAMPLPMPPAPTTARCLRGVFMMVRCLAGDRRRGGRARNLGLSLPWRLPVRAARKIFCSIYEHLCVYRISAEDSTKSGGRWTNQLFQAFIAWTICRRTGAVRAVPAGPRRSGSIFLEPGERLCKLSRLWIAPPRGVHASPRPWSMARPGP